MVVSFLLVYVEIFFFLRISSHLQKNLSRFLTVEWNNNYHDGIPCLAPTPIVDPSFQRKRFKYLRLVSLLMLFNSWSSTSSQCMQCSQCTAQNRQPGSANCWNWSDEARRMLSRIFLPILGVRQASSEPSDRQQISSSSLLLCGRGLQR